MLAALELADSPPRDGSVIGIVDPEASSSVAEVVDIELDQVQNSGMDAEVTTRHEAELALRQCGLQPTAQRVEVLWRLRQSQTHLSADDLYVVLAGEGKKISRATVFNTLTALKDYQLVNEIIVEPGRVLYDPVMEPHFHFYDVDTHELRDLPAENFGITCLPVLPTGTEFRGLDVVVKISRK